MKKITKSAAIALLDKKNVKYSWVKTSLEELEMKLDTWEPKQPNGTMYAENGLRMIRLYEDEEGRDRRSHLILTGKENVCYEYTNPNGVHSIICDFGFSVAVYTIIEGVAVYRQ